MLERFKNWFQGNPRADHHDSDDYWEDDDYASQPLIRSGTESTGQVIEVDDPDKPASLDAGIVIDQTDDYIDAEIVDEEESEHSTDIDNNHQQSWLRRALSPKGESPEDQESFEDVEEQVPEAVEREFIDDLSWLDDFIKSHYPDISEEEISRIKQEFGQPENKEKFFQKVTSGIKSGFENIAGEFVAGGVAGLVGKAGVNYAIGLAKNTLRSGLIIGAASGPSMAAGLVPAALAGATAGSVVGGVRTFLKERKKIDLTKYEQEIDSVIDSLQPESGKMPSMLAIDAAQKIGQTEKQLQSEGFNLEELSQNIELKNKILKAKVLLELAVNNEKVESSDSELEKINHILQFCKNSRKDLSFFGKIKNNKEVSKFIKQVQFETQKVEFKDYRGKLARGIIKGAITGAVGGTIGGIVHDYVTSHLSGRSVDEMVKPSASDAMKNTAPTLSQEQINGVTLAETARATQEALNNLKTKDFVMVADKGDGELRMYRQALHDYLINSGKLNGQKLGDFSDEQLIYAEEYLKKQVDKAGGVSWPKGMDDAIEPGDRITIKGSFLVDALKQANTLTDEQEQNLESLLQTKDHSLSEQSLEQMHAKELRILDNEFSEIKIDKDRIEDQLEKLSAEPIAVSSVQDKTEDIPAESATTQESKRKKSKNNLIYLITGLGVTAGAALAAATYALRKSRYNPEDEFQESDYEPEEILNDASNASTESTIEGEYIEPDTASGNSLRKAMFSKLNEQTDFGSSDSKEDDQVLTSKPSVKGVLAGKVKPSGNNNTKSDKTFNTRFLGLKKELSKALNNDQNQSSDKKPNSGALGSKEVVEKSVLAREQWVSNLTQVNKKRWNDLINRDKRNSLWKNIIHRQADQETIDTVYDLLTKNVDYNNEKIQEPLIDSMILLMEIALEERQPQTSQAFKIIQTTFGLMGDKGGKNREEFIKVWNSSNTGRERGFQVLPKTRGFGLVLKASQTKK
ncbi:MAG: hypothetical protein R3B41_01670 [Candidatus Doudnabacteria bacterium]